MPDNNKTGRLTSELAECLRSVNFGPEFQFQIVDPIAKLVGEKTTAELAAQALDQLVDLDVIAERIADLEEMNKKWP